MGWFKDVMQAGKGSMPGGGFNPTRESTARTMEVIKNVKKEMMGETGDNKRLARNSFIDNVFRDPVTPLSGAVVICDLAHAFEHSGIYIGNDEIMHRSGEGNIEIVDPDKFLSRMGGINPALSIYVSCHGIESLNLPDAANRAREAMYDDFFKGYDILNKNCHYFTRYCLTGDATKEACSLDFTFTALEKLLKEKFNLDNWRVWNYK